MNYDEKFTYNGYSPFIYKKVKKDAPKKQTVKNCR